MQHSSLMFIKQLAATSSVMELNLLKQFMVEILVKTNRKSKITVEYMHRAVRVALDIN